MGPTSPRLWDLSVSLCDAGWSHNVGLVKGAVMKRLGSVVGGDALASALADMTASRARRSASGGGPSDRPVEVEPASLPLADAARVSPSGASQAVHQLGASRAKVQADKADALMRFARQVGFDPETFAKIESATKALKSPSKDWTFVMISPAQNAAVVSWLAENSKRPQTAIVLWARLFERLRYDTGQILQTRSELAARLGVAPRHISEIMTELSSINAVRRERDGRSMRYFLNPSIATHIASAQLRELSRGFAGPILVAIPGGQDSAA